MLGFEVSARTVAKYMRVRPNWACDFFCVRRVLFRTLHVFFVVRLANRGILHFEVTRHPTADWAALLVVTFRGNSDPSFTLELGLPSGSYAIR